MTDYTEITPEFEPEVKARFLFLAEGHEENLIMIHATLRGHPVSVMCLNDTGTQSIIPFTIILTEDDMRNLKVEGEPLIEFEETEEDD